MINEMMNQYFNIELNPQEKIAEAAAADAEDQQQVKINQVDNTESFGEIINKFKLKFKDSKFIQKLIDINKTTDVNELKQNLKIILHKCNNAL